MMNLKLPVLESVLEEVNFFERERTEKSYVKLGLVLYDAGLSLRKTSVGVVGCRGFTRCSLGMD